MGHYYLNRKDEKDKYKLPDLEVYRLTDWEQEDDDDHLAAGWYYRFCFPGCLPDSDPYGPYDTEQEALVSAREDHADWDDDLEDDEEGDA